MSEEVLQGSRLAYQQGAVTVDDRFARFGSKSFAINKITSLDVREDTKRGSRDYVTWGALAAICLLFALSGQSLVPLVVGAVLGIFGWLSWEKRHSSTTYRLFLVTAASEAQAYETQDHQEAMALRDAIEDAMARS